MRDVRPLRPGGLLLSLAVGVLPPLLAGCGGEEQKTGAVLETRKDMVESAQATDDYFNQQSKAAKKAR